MGNAHPPAYSKVLRWKDAYIKELDLTDSSKQTALVHFNGFEKGYDDYVAVKELNLHVDVRNPAEYGVWRIGKLLKISNSRIEKVLVFDRKLEVNSNTDIAPLHTHTLPKTDLFVGQHLDALAHPHGATKDHLWYKAEIREIRYSRWTRIPKRILIHYAGKSDAWDEWIEPTHQYIARAGVYTDTSRFHNGDSVDVLEPEGQSSVKVLHGQLIMTRGETTVRIPPQRVRICRTDLFQTLIPTRIAYFTPKTHVSISLNTSRLVLRDATENVIPALPSMRLLKK